MGKIGTSLFAAGVMSLVSFVGATEYYKIDRGLFSSAFYMIRLESNGSGQINQFERLHDGVILVRHEHLSCSVESCSGGLFFLDRNPFALQYGENFLKLNLGIPEQATKLEYFEAENRAGYLSSTACVYEAFKSQLSPQALTQMNVSFPGLAHFPDFYERSTKVEFQAEILGVLKKILGRDFDHSPVEACIDRNFLLE